MEGGEQADERGIERKRLTEKTRTEVQRAAELPETKTTQRICVRVSDCEKMNSLRGCCGCERKERGANGRIRLRKNELSRQGEK